MTNHDIRKLIIVGSHIRWEEFRQLANGELPTNEEKLYGFLVNGPDRRCMIPCADEETKAAARQFAGRATICWFAGPIDYKK